MNTDTKKHDATDETMEMESYPVLDAGVYRAKLETIESLETKFGDALQFTWRVIGGENDGDTFNGLANKKLMPKSKLAMWAKAHLNMAAFPADFVLKLSSLIGKEVHVTLSVEPRNDGSGDRNVVQAVSPYKPTSKKAKVATPVTPDVVEALQHLSRDASDFLGRSISSSAIVRALVRQTMRQGPPASDALFLEVERELKQGVMWGK